MSKCKKCGEVHDPLPSLGFNEPYYYNLLNKVDKKQLAELSSDFCIIKYPEQTDRFIRTYMRMQINDACDDLDYGIWVSVSEKTFNEYKSEFHHNTEGRTYFGRICNDIPDYKETTLGLHVNIVTKPDGSRPEIIPHVADHQLIIDYEQGLTLHEVQERINRINNNAG